MLSPLSMKQGTVTSTPSSSSLFFALRYGHTDGRRDERMKLPGPSGRARDASLIIVVECLQDACSAHVNVALVLCL